MKKLLLITALHICSNMFAQDTLVTSGTPCFPTAGSRSLSQQTIKTRSWFAAGASIAGYGATLSALSQEWYSKYPQTRFHFFNDNEEWLQMDKAGHVFSAYTAGRITMEAWRWAGVSRKQRIWAGGLSGAAFMTVIEILDGFSSEWGFSVGDMTANLAGSGLLIAQELAWNEQRVQIKFSFHRNDYGSADLNQRANDLFGRKDSERMLKDYNGQTYWASANIRSFLKHSRVPSWLNIAIGYGAEGMFGGTINQLKDGNGNIIFDRRDVPRYRHWYIAPDIDLTRIKTKSRILKAALFVLNAYKFPTPSLGFSARGVEWKWIHF